MQRIKNSPDPGWHFTLGGRGPEVNEFGLDVMVRRYQGKADEFLDWRAGFPLHSEDETFPGMYVSAIRPVQMPAGIMEAEVEWVGMIDDPTTRPCIPSDTSDPADLELVGQIVGTLKHETWAGGYTYNVSESTETIEHLCSARVIVPTFVYRYASKTRVNEARYLSNAQELFAERTLSVTNLAPKQLVFNAKEITEGRLSRPISWEQTSIGLAENWRTQLSAVARITNNPRGKFFEVEETVEFTTIKTDG